MESEIKRIQEHLLDIFGDVIRICEKLNIAYFIVGGTALGAVRHGGFIPWDDDLDIGMTRENYDRFLTEAPKHLKADLFLQTFETEPNSPFYFAKVRKDHTLFMENYCRKIQMHQGISIDIFPYDPIPDGMKQRERHYKKIKYLMNLYAAKSVSETSAVYHGMQKLLYTTIRKTLCLLVKPVSKRYLYLYLEKKLTKYCHQKTEYLGYAGIPKIELRTDQIEQGRLKNIKFEHLVVKCPDKIEVYLKSNYGNYMVLPPEKERAGHRPYKVKL